MDRGWLPEDFKGLNMHWGANEETEIEGVLTLGEGKSHTGKNNDEVNKIRIDLEEFIQKTEFSNKDIATRLLIKEVDFNADTFESKRSIKRPSPADLCFWYVTPERH